jgi:hypothetical protein
MEVIDLLGGTADYLARSKLAPARNRLNKYYSTGFAGEN